MIKVFDMTAASTGINERTAKQAGIDYDKVYLSPASHASYYPGGKVMTMKVIFEKKTYKLLGAQIIGYVWTRGLMCSQLPCMQASQPFS